MVTEEAKEPTRKQWRGFWAMIVQQSQNAFNDKLAQFTLIPLGAALGISLESQAGIMIALPFILFAPIAGWMSDRYSKRNVMIGAAVAQVVILIWIVVSVKLHSLNSAMLGFFLLAVQSAFYSPAKIGINKELLGSNHLGFAAGIQTMSSLAAILAGQILAGWIFDHRYKEFGGSDAAAWQAAFPPLVIIALISVPALLITWLIPPTPPQPCRTPLSWKLSISHFTDLKTLWSDVPLRWASWGVSYFWGFAAFINLWSIKVAKDLTDGKEGYGTMSSQFMAAASLGMVAGFAATAWILRKKIDLGWVPIGGVAMALIAMLLAWIPPGGWPFLTVLALLAFASAIFLAPLHAWMQDRYPADQRGELQSAVNLQDCLAGIIAIALIFGFEWMAQRLGISAMLGFGIQMFFAGLLTIVLTMWLMRNIRCNTLRLLGNLMIKRIYTLKVVGADHVPAAGGVLILPNHVTFADAFWISASMERPVRFVMDEAFMKKPWIKKFVGHFNTITIRQDQPLAAMRIIIDALKDGDAICFFPEGQLTRTGGLSALQRGCELIAKKAGAPIIPLWCDGAWGSIFSYERGVFFRKLPRALPYPLTLAFGPAMEAKSATRTNIGNALLDCSARALDARFSDAEWQTRELKSNPQDLLERRRIWINAYQIGQVHALQRDACFFYHPQDPIANELPALFLAFPELFKATPTALDSWQEGVWVGGNFLREMFEKQPPTMRLDFYDLSDRALEPIESPRIRHFPCLAIAGKVIAMSMPDPVPGPDPHLQQVGSCHKTWGKLLPGWVLRDGKCYGPAADDAGLMLPQGAHIDEEFLVRS